jgi:hypothetical protein
MCRYGRVWVAEQGVSPSLQSWETCAAIEVVGFMNPYFSHSHISALQSERERRLDNRRPGGLWTWFEDLVHRVNAGTRAGGESLREVVAAARAEPCIDCP